MSPNSPRVEISVLDIMQKIMNLGCKGTEKFAGMQIFEVKSRNGKVKACSRSGKIRGKYGMVIAW
jgi:hypothetical protein